MFSFSIKQVNYGCCTDKLTPFFYLLHTQHAMDVMAIDGDTQTDIMNIVAGILHLGNIAFTEEGNYAIPEDDGCELLAIHFLHWVTI